MGARETGHLSRLRHDVQLDPGLLLQIADDAEKVAGLWLACAAERNRKPA